MIVTIARESLLGVIGVASFTAALFMLKDALEQLINRIGEPAQRKKSIILIALSIFFLFISLFITFRSALILKHFSKSGISSTTAAALISQTP